MITLDEYLHKMPAKQKHLYYYCCSDRTVCRFSVEYSVDLNGA